MQTIMALISYTALLLAILMSVAILYIVYRLNKLEKKIDNGIQLNIIQHEYEECDSDRF